MIKYAKVENEETKQCSVGLGTDTEYYESIGMTEMDVEQAWNGVWYLAGYAPEEPPAPEPSLLDRVAALEEQYKMYRWEREAILAENSDYSEFTKNRAQEIEDLAAELRG